MSNKIFLGYSCVHVGETNNGKHYVCNSSALIDGNKICEIGEGPTLDVAKEQANKKLQNIVKHYEENTKNFTFTNKVTSPQNSDNTKDMLKGGGQKPISERQSTLIYDIADRVGYDANKLAMKHYGKQLHQFTGQEADSLIKELKKRQ